MDFLTIGHSTNTKEQFIKLLHDAEITFIADVRSFPMSRKHPHFNQDQFTSWLKEINIDYQHFPLLGGRRSLSETVGESLNAGWNNRSFHNYADYTLTDEFKIGLHELIKRASDNNLAYLCSERHPSRCHRLLISNCLTAMEHKVTHVMKDFKGETIFVEHELGKWGAMPILEQDGLIVYPTLNHEA